MENSCYNISFAATGTTPLFHSLEISFLQTNKQTNISAIYVIDWYQVSVDTQTLSISNDIESNKGGLLCP